MDTRGRFRFAAASAFLTLSICAMLICAEGIGAASRKREKLIVYPDSFKGEDAGCMAISDDYPSPSEYGIVLPEYVRLLNADGSTAEILFEDYIAGVVAAEMPRTFDIEALKAQAVAARSYTLYRIRWGSGHAGGCEVCGDYRCCAAYYSLSDAAERFGETEASLMFEAAGRAVEETRGIVMLYDGEEVCAVFHSSSDGRTASSKEVWGGDFAYLNSVETFEEARISELSFTGEEINDILAANGYDIKISANTYISAVEGTLFIDGANIEGVEARRLFGLASAAFEAVYNNDVLTFHVHGYGHGVGMSQYGAQSMAEDGLLFNEILLHYYSGVTLYKQKNYNCA